MAMIPRPPVKSACYLAVCLVLWLTWTDECSAATKKVLLIGIDGCRFDAVRAADAPNIMALAAEGALDEQTLILGDRYQKNDTCSGPGWSSILCGVWADKHGVDDNDFRAPKLTEYPAFFRRVKDADPAARTASLVDWLPIYQYIVSGADDSVFLPPADEYRGGDEMLTRVAVNTLAQRDPAALFLYLGQVDEAGHKHGFHPNVPEYAAAIERVDRLVGIVVKAVRARPNLAGEDWLIMLTTDHGGKGKGHGGGHKTPEILHSFIILNGASVEKGKLRGPTYIVDVPVTAMTHLGVKIDPEWKLDGRAVGLKK